MKLLRAIILITTTIVAASCSTTRYHAGGNNHSGNESTQEIPKPTFVSPGRECPKIGETPIATEKSKTPATTSNKEITPSYDFTKNELEHVSLSNYDPFSQDNTFTLDLDNEQRQFTFPLNVSRLSSGYGTRGRKFHSGIDLLDNQGAPIYAAFDGVVRMSKPYAGYGNVVVLRHSNGLETVYSHNTKNIVSVGDFVRSGQQIATLGRTGNATGNHLHFEIRIAGQTIDPQLMIDLEKKSLQRGSLHVSRSGGAITAKNLNSGQTSVVRPSQPTPDAKVTTTNPAPAAKYHVVVKGDTLYAISRKYGTSVSTICRLNNISEKTILALGRKLRVK